MVALEILFQLPAVAPSVMGAVLTHPVAGPLFGLYAAMVAAVVYCASNR